MNRKSVLREGEAPAEPMSREVPLSVKRPIKGHGLGEGIAARGGWLWPLDLASEPFLNTV